MSNTNRPTKANPAGTNVSLPADWEGFVRELQAHEPEALARFFDLYFDRVYGHVRGLIGDQQLAEDLTQDVFLNVYRRIESYDPQRDILPWLHTIATNKVRDYWRSRRHADSQRESSIDVEDSAQHLPSEEDGPHVALESDEVATRVRQAVASLPKGMRDTVIMRAFEGMPFKQIGEILGRNEAAVRKRYSRALDLLQARLGSQMSPVTAA
ncbi:MAG: RNA polymerase sigma factor [Planctomycetes bacterium]|nr:RNA polymerase sigma factor [Planctomycetota bacterium]MCB9905181.1 RNA polymerase sigma factor [Planctomycetota bacterium]